jgi:U4/U6.U5 tri-snRNP-associated protein 1
MNNKKIQESNYLTNMKKVELESNKSFINEYSNNYNHYDTNKIRKNKNKPRKLLTVNDLDLVEEYNKNEGIKKIKVVSSVDDYEYLEELIDIEREKIIMKTLKEKKLESNNSTNKSQMNNNEDTTNNYNDIIKNEKSNLLSSYLVEEDSGVFNNKNLEINQHDKLNDHKIANNTKQDNILLGNKRINESINNTIVINNNTKFNYHQAEKELTKEISNNLINEKIKKSEEKDYNKYDPKNDVEPLIGKGAFNALCILRSRGYLDNHEFVGRYKEKDPHKSYYNENDKIKLEYRDNLGRLMTSKQANRYLSRIFQGKNKHNNNVEKELVKDQLENDKKNKDINNDSLMMSMLKKHQNKFKTPGMTLQSSKPIFK